MLAPAISWAAKGTDASNTTSNNRIVVVGLNDNVSSNHFLLSDLAEATNCNADSISQIYNKVIIDNLSRNALKSGLGLYAPAANLQPLWNNILKNAVLGGEYEESTSDFSRIDVNQFRKVMEDEKASYLLVLDCHYLKYQERPLLTLFHFVNYSLYDVNEKKVASGQCYFTSFAPQNAKEMEKSSEKVSKKILASLSKQLD